MENHLSPFPGDEYQIENHRFMDADNYQLNVYAGALGQDMTQGVLIIFALPTHWEEPLSEQLASLPGKPLLGAHPTAQKAGAVHITRATGQRLQLNAADGTSFTFDLPSASFVSP